MGRRRIEEMFERTRTEGRAAFLPFLTAGLPTPADSARLFEAMAESGADGFEVGIPYSDPLMDGPVIQRGSDAAIAAGTDLDTALGVAGRVASGGLPALAMTYANPIFRRGIERFCERLAELGVDGLIVPDLPVEESAPLRQAAARHGLGVVLFLAPTSDAARIEAVLEAEPVFVYAVAEMGVTGERAGSGGRLGSVIAAVRERSQVPVVAGVGISTPDQALAAAAAGADGVIVGSALVRRVLEAADAADAQARLREAVGQIAAALGTSVHI